MFRQELPQKGRYRQCFQIGIEAIGTDAPTIDAEVIEIGVRYLREAGVRPTLLLNSIGHLDGSCRLGYLDALKRFLADHVEDLAEEDRGRLTTNPLRTFDSKNEKTQKVLSAAPVITDHLCDACADHFQDVRTLLDEIGVDYTLDPTLVRGLDYYTRTAFEFIAGELGAQNAVGGGGRYDGLAESLGGRRLPGIGFALGLDRIVLARGGSTDPPATPIDVYVVSLGDEAQREAFKVATRLRSAGIGVELDHVGRAMKGQMKDAARSGARWALILGDDELRDASAALKDLTTGEQQNVPLDDIENRLRR